MRKFAEERDFANDITGYTSFRCGVSVWDSFDGYSPVGGALSSLVDRSISSLTNQIGAGFV